MRPTLNGPVNVFWSKRPEIEACASWLALKFDFAIANMPMLNPSDPSNNVSLLNRTILLYVSSFVFRGGTSKGHSDLLLVVIP